jgi:hypothetical protein
MVQLRVIQGGRSASNGAARKRGPRTRSLTLICTSAGPHRRTTKPVNYAVPPYLSHAVIEAWAPVLAALTHWNGAVSSGVLTSNMRWLKLAAAVNYCAAAALHPQIATIERSGRYPEGKPANQKPSHGPHTERGGAPPNRTTALRSLPIEIARLRWGSTCVY